MPKSDVTHLFAAFGESGANYKEIFDQQAGANAQETWPLLRQFSAARDRAEASAEPAAAADASKPAAGQPHAFPLLGNVRLDEPSRPRHAPRRPAAARGGTDLKQLFSRLAGDADRPQAEGAAESPAPQRADSGEGLGSVFSRLSGKGPDEPEKADPARLFPGLRK